MKFAITPNAISSPELAVGPLPCSKQDGHKPDLFGLEAPLASPTARQVTKKAKTTNATSTPCGKASYASAALQASMESRLQQRLPMGGLTMFIQGWKQKVTPSGRRYCQLAVSARPTDASACGLWPTVTTQDNVQQTGQYGKKGGTTLGAAARNLWPTPKASTAGPDFAKLERSATGISLQTAVALSLWATPRSSDHKGGGATVMRKDGKLRNDTLMYQTERFGPERVGQGAPTQSNGSLHPAFPCWLMGFPTAALSSMLSAMQSFRK